MACWIDYYPLLAIEARQERADPPACGLRCSRHALDPFHGPKRLSQTSPGVPAVPEFTFRGGPKTGCRWDGALSGDCREPHHPR